MDDFGSGIRIKRLELLKLTPLVRLLMLSMKFKEQKQIKNALKTKLMLMPTALFLMPEVMHKNYCRKLRLINSKKLTKQRVNPQDF
jgi:hypothetical protein